MGDDDNLVNLYIAESSDVAKRAIEDHVLVFVGRRGAVSRRIELQFESRVGLNPDASGEAVRDIVRRGIREKLFFNSVTIARSMVSVDVVVPEDADTDEKMTGHVDACREKVRWILLAVEERWPCP